eukprot:9474570-Pyramimonas_sp.AAC.1
MTKFEEVAGVPMQGNDARGGTEIELPQEDGRFPTVYEESEADFEADIMEVRCTERQDDRGLLEAIPTYEFHIVPTQMITDNIDATGKYHVQLCSTDEDDSYGSYSEEHEHCVEFCVAADMPTVVSSEQRHRIVGFVRATTLRVYVTAAARRCAVVKDDDLLTKGDIQGNPFMESKALYTEVKT